MKTALKILLVFFAFVTSYFFSFWMMISIIPEVHNTSRLQFVISLLIATATGIFVWKKTEFKTLSLAAYVLFGGIIIGGFGLILGFIGPLIFHWGGNQGPLLGILYTGPLGFIIGLIAGAVYWRVKANKQVTTN